MLLAASATATTKVAGSARGAESAAAPFAQSWAKVPQTTAGRKAKSVLVFGVEQDINGFNTVLACCNQLIGGFMGAAEAQHGAFNQNEKGVWFKDLVSSASATKTSLSYTIKPNANWYWGGKKLPVTYKDFVYTLQKIDDPATSRCGPDRLQQHRHDELAPTRDRSRSPSIGRRRAARGLPLRPVCELAEHLLRSLSCGGARRPGLQQDLDELHLR